MEYRVIHTYLGTKKIHFPIEMDLKEDNKTMEYTVHIPEQKLKIAMEFALDEPVWVGPTRWDFIKEETKQEKQEIKQEKQDNRELPMLGEAYW